MVVLCLVAVVCTEQGLAQQPHAVQYTHHVPFGDLNRDCAPDTALVDQLGNGLTRVRSIVWGVLTDSLDVCDSIKRMSNPFPVHDTLVFAYRQYTRPRSAFIALKDPTDTAHVQMRLTVYGHMNASADTILYPQVFDLDNHKDIDSYDTIVVDSWTDLDNVVGVSKHVRAIDTNDLVVFVHRQFDAVRVHAPQPLLQAAPPHVLTPMLSERGNENAEPTAAGLGSRVSVTVYGIEVTVPHGTGEHRLQVYSLLGELLYEDPSLSGSTVRDITVALRPGTYAAVIHVRNASPMVLIFQKGG
jgi:hypothetical protein